VFLAGIERMELPIAHAEGKFVCASASVLAELESCGQVALRFAVSGRQAKCATAELATVGSEEARRGAATTHELSGRASRLPLPYPANPNGSVADIAGLCDPTGRMFGLMPHPERHINAQQHPRWTRRRAQREGDGLAVFRNAVKFFD
jgi:phosphoribosylformylglycinamidine synthase